MPEETQVHPEGYKLPESVRALLVQECTALIGSIEQKEKDMAEAAKRLEQAKDAQYARRVRLQEFLAMLEIDLDTFQRTYGRE